MLPPTNIGLPIMEHVSTPSNSSKLNSRHLRSHLGPSSSQRGTSLSLPSELQRKQQATNNLSSTPVTRFVRADSSPQFDRPARLAYLESSRTYTELLCTLDRSLIVQQIRCVPLIKLVGIIICPPLLISLSLSLPCRPSLANLYI